MWVILALIGLLLLISCWVMKLRKRISSLEAEVEVTKSYYKKTLEFVRYERLSNNVKKTILGQLREQISNLLDQIDNDNNRSKDRN